MTPPCRPPRRRRRGAWSKVRPPLSDATPEYVGTTFVETYLYDADRRHAATAAAVGGGAMYALTPGKGIVAHREAGDILHTYVELTRPAEWIAGIDFTDAAAATARVAAEFDGWAPELTALITDGETAPVPRMIYTHPGRAPLGSRARGDAPRGRRAPDAAVRRRRQPGDDRRRRARPGDRRPSRRRRSGARRLRSGRCSPAAQSFAADAREILELCLGDRAPFGLIEFLTGAPAA